MNPIKIAIVDDQQLFLNGFTLLLSRDNYLDIIFSSSNPIEALDLLKTNDIDVLLSDISMPQLNGIEFIKQVKIKYPLLKIIVISTYNDVDSLHHVDAYLSKDTPIEKVISVIKDVFYENKNFFEHTLDPSKALLFERVLLGTREKEIIKLIINEFTTDEIAEKLFISKATVETHRRNIFAKLQVSNIAGLTKKAIQLGIM